MAGKTLKGRSGQFKVFHLGKCYYTVERDGEVLRTFTDLSSAYHFARRQHDAAKVHDLAQLASDEASESILHQRPGEA